MFSNVLFSVLFIWWSRDCISADFLVLLLLGYVLSRTSASCLNTKLSRNGRVMNLKSCNKKPKMTSAVLQEMDTHYIYPQFAVWWCDSQTFTVYKKLILI